MLQNDYLMRIIMQFVIAWQQALNQRNLSAAERAAGLEEAIGDAVNIEPRLLLAMEPESFISMLQLGDFDEEIGGYVLRSLYFEADLLEEAGNNERADLRRAQADAIAHAYGFDVTAADANPEALTAFMAERESKPEPESSHEDNEENSPGTAPLAY